MARIETRMYILSSYLDYISNFGYLRVLADFGCITIRVSKRQIVDNEFYLSPDLYLNVELEQGQKNWVLKEILGYKKIIELKCYYDHLMITKVKQFLAKNIKENQEFEILEELIEYMKKIKEKGGMVNFDLKKFQLMIFQKLGFSGAGRETDYHLQQAHYDNDLN